MHSAQESRPFNRVQVESDSSPRKGLLWEKGAGKLTNKSEYKIELCRMIRPVRCEQGDEAVLLDLMSNKMHTKALVDTGASDCFMGVEFRAPLPDSCIKDKWEVEKGTISLADNSSQTILEEIRAKFKLAESTIYYDFSIVDSLYHEVVIGRNLLTVLISEVSLPGDGTEVFCGNPMSSCEYVKIPPWHECIIPVAPWHPVDADKNSVYCSSAVTAPVIVESCVNVSGEVCWLKVMNPLKEKQEITVNDVLEFAEKCTTPELDEEGVEQF